MQMYEPAKKANLAKKARQGLTLEALTHCGGVPACSALPTCRGRVRLSLLGGATVRQSTMK